MRSDVNRKWANEKRLRVIGVRVSDSEHSKVLDLVKDANKTISDYIRDLLGLDSGAQDEGGKNEQHGN